METTKSKRKRLESVATELAQRKSWPTISPFIAERTGASDATGSAEDWSPVKVCPLCSGKRRCHDHQATDAALTLDEASGSRDPEMRGQPRAEDGHPKALNFDFLWNKSGEASSTFGGFQQPTAAAQFAPFFGMGGGAGGTPGLAYQQLLWQAMLAAPFAGFMPQSAATAPQSAEEASATAAALGLSLEPPPPKARKKESTVKMEETKTSTEEPLDLSQKLDIKDEDPSPFQAASSSGVQDFLTSNGLPIVKASVNGAASNPSTKRNYSQADLEKAVKDIRSGRLGTRRASVVYGIPRSTLRNKIYKLEAAEEGVSGSGRKRGRTGMAVSSSPLLDKAEESLGPPDEDSSGLDLSTKAADEANDPEPPPNQGHLLQSLLVEHMMRENARLLAGGAASGNGWMQGQDWLQLQSAYAPLLNKLWPQNGDTPAETEDVPPPLRPSSKPARVSSKSPSKAGSVTSRRDSESSTPNAQGSSPKDWGRKARPKRGQYRKYDKNALDEAVRAVRSGEMSVHRAGSFYGVPHSTLEYKVKERNLLRTNAKKRKEEEAPKDEETSNPTPKASGLEAWNLSSAVAEEGGEESGDRLFASEMMRKLKESAPPEPIANSA